MTPTNLGMVVRVITMGSLYIFNLPVSNPPLGSSMNRQSDFLCASGDKKKKKFFFLSYLNRQTLDLHSHYGLGVLFDIRVWGCSYAKVKRALYGPQKEDCIYAYESE